MAPWTGSSFATTRPPSVLGWEGSRLLCVSSAGRGYLAGCFCSSISFQEGWCRFPETSCRPAPLAQPQPSAVPPFRLSSPAFSALQCDNGLEYDPCGPSCPQTCQNFGLEPAEHCEDLTCVEGCFCPEGRVLHGKRAECQRGAQSGGWGRGCQCLREAAECPSAEVEQAGVLLLFKARGD